MFSGVRSTSKIWFKNISNVWIGTGYAVGFSGGYLETNRIKRYHSSEWCSYSETLMSRCFSTVFGTFVYMSVFLSYPLNRLIYDLSYSQMIEECRSNGLLVERVDTDLPTRLENAYTFTCQELKKKGY